MRAAGHVGMAGAIPTYPVIEIPSSRRGQRNDRSQGTGKEIGLSLKVPSYRRAATKQNKRQLTGKKQIADNDYEVIGLEGTSY